MAGRPFVFPDPNDRSPNDPSIIVSTEQILGIYNQDCNEEMQRVADKVKECLRMKQKVINGMKLHLYIIIFFSTEQFYASIKL